MTKPAPVLTGQVFAINKKGWSVENLDPAMVRLD